MPKFEMDLTNAQVARFNAAYKAKHGAGPTKNQALGVVQQFLESYVQAQEREAAVEKLTSLPW